MESFICLLYGIGLTLIVGSYLFLIGYFIKYEIYKDIDWFDFFILISGPIGVLIIIVMGSFTYEEDEEDEY